MCLLDDFMIDTLRYFCGDDEERSKLWLAAADKALGTRELNQAFYSMLKKDGTHERLPSLDGRSAAEEDHAEYVSVAAGALTSSGSSSNLGCSPARLLGKKRGRGE